MKNLFKIYAKSIQNRSWGVLGETWGGLGGVWGPSWPQDPQRHRFLANLRKVHPQVGGQKSKKIVVGLFLASLGTVLGLFLPFLVYFKMKSYCEIVLASIFNRFATPRDLENHAPVCTVSEFS